MKKPHFPSFAVSKENGILKFQDFQRISLSINSSGLFKGLSERSNATFNVIKNADNVFKFDDFPTTIINVTDSDDHFAWGVENEMRILNYCTRWYHFSDVCPDFVFDSWPIAGLENYDLFCNEIAAAGEHVPKRNSIIWRGSNDNNIRVRTKLLSLNDGNLFDFKSSKNVNVNKTLNPWDEDYITLFDQIKNNKYLIDVAGYGYSGRLKLLMFSRRVVFIVDRRYQEWFWPKMEPWVHYIPVKRDLSDLRENFEIIDSDQKLQNKIIDNATNFANSNLKYEHALARWNYLLNVEPKRVNRFENFINQGEILEYCREDD